MWGLNSERVASDAKDHGRQGGRLTLLPRLFGPARLRSGHQRSLLGHLQEKDEREAVRRSNEKKHQQKVKRIKERREKR